MVVYERPPRTTPPVGKLEKANPAVVIVKHKDYHRDHFKDDGLTTPLRNPTNEHGPVHIPVEDHLMQQAKENSEHQIASSKDEVLPGHGEQSESTLVHITPDNGAPGGAASIVNQVPKEMYSDASAARMVSLLPDTATSPTTVNHNAPYNLQAYGQARNGILQQSAAIPNSNVANSMLSQGYRYYSYPNFGLQQNAQARSLPGKANWQSVYKQLLQRKQSGK